MADEMKNSKKATVLAYTEKEQAAIAALEAHRGEPLTLKELGIAPGTIVSLTKKAKKVEAGELSVPEGVEVIHVNRTENEEPVQTVKTVKRYCID